MAAKISPRDARRRAATAMRRLTAAGADETTLAKLQELDLQLDAAIGRYQDAKQHGTPASERRAAAKSLDKIVADIGKLTDRALAAAR